MLSVRPLITFVCLSTIGMATSVTFGQTAFTNFETAPVHPIEITPDGTTLLLTNTAAGTLEVFTLGGSLPVWSATIPVGIDPVSVRLRSNSEAWVVNQVSDSVSIVNLITRNVVATLKPGNEPCDVAFIGSGAAQRAYVSVSRENLMRVFDPNIRTAAPTTVALAGTCPRTLLSDGTRIIAAFFEGGNRTSIAPRSIVDDPTGPWAGMNPPPNVANGTFSPPLTPGLPPAPPSSLIMNKEGTNWKDAANVVWSSKIPWALHEHGIAFYTPGTGVTTYATNICNINMSMAMNPANTRLSVVGHHLTNYVRFEPADRSVFGRSIAVTIDPLTAGTTAFVDFNSHLFVNGVTVPYITNPTPQQVLNSVSDPRAIVFRDASNYYAAGMGSKNVVRTNTSGARQATIVVGNGPCGLAMDTARSRLYVFNRFDGTLTSINSATDAVIGTVPFYDPTPPVIRQGRGLFYDAHATSKLGIVSCNSCHVDTRSDMQSWDAGDPSGTMKVFNQTCNIGLPASHIGADWHPLKGPLMTQNLADTVGNNPLHWRGDREDMLAFGGGFPGFLGLASPPPVAQVQQMADFLATLRRQPNPYRTVTSSLPASVPGLSGNPVNGAALFSGPAFSGAIASCVQCHTLQNGGGTTIISAAVLGQSQGLKPQTLRDLYVKTGFDRSSQSGRRGFGFGHDGSWETIASFLQTHFTPGATPQQLADIEAYLYCFDSGTHAAVGTQITFDSTNKTDPTLVSLLSTLTTLADSGVIGLTAHGIVGGVPRGYMYVGGTGSMQSDRLAETANVAALRLAIVNGAELTFTAVDSGTQRRLGIDRDADGYLDRDEVDNGSNPADPLSIPPLACRPTISQQPGDVSIAAGQNASFTVAASNAVAYQWRHAGVPLNNGGNVSGATASTLLISSALAVDAGQYDCLVSNGCGGTPSAPANLAVNTCPADFNNDGASDFFDYLDFVAAFSSSLPESDFNGDGSIDFFDYLDFVAAFSTGC